MSGSGKSAKPVRRRRKGTLSREAMMAKRSLPPVIDPSPPGPAGGQYRPLSDKQVEQIYATSLRMLGELGMGDAPDVLVEKALQQGASINQLLSLIHI